MYILVRRRLDSTDPHICFNTDICMEYRGGLSSYPYYIKEKAEQSAQGMNDYHGRRFIYTVEKCKSLEQACLSGYVLCAWKDVGDDEDSEE